MEHELEEWEIELATEWIESKGVSLWPSLADGDPTRPSEARELAKWFLRQTNEYLDFYEERIPPQ